MHGTLVSSGGHLVRGMPPVHGRAASDPVCVLRTAQVYLHRVSKTVHPELSISKRSMAVLQSFTVDMFERLVAEAARATARSGRETLSSREVSGSGPDCRARL